MLPRSVAVLSGCVLDCREDLRSLGISNGPSYASHKEVWQYAGVKRTGTDRNYISRANGRKRFWQRKTLFGFQS